MVSSRYKEARTLVRGACRLPGESRDAYRLKVRRLRDHFERFNVDVSELCQWLMGLRKRYGSEGSPASFGALGDFLLEPSLEDVEAEETERDRWRLAVFDDVAGIRPASSLGGRPVPGWLRDGMRAESEGERTPTSTRLFERLRALQPAHRLVLLKSAAEWVVARYKRGMENWIRRQEEWEREKAEWERAHPELTSAIRERFNAVFDALNDPSRPNKPGVKRGRARICEWERLRQNLDNCVYAGRMGHGPLCWKFEEFVKSRKHDDPRFNEKAFLEDANTFASLCNEFHSRPSMALKAPKVCDRLWEAHRSRQEAKRKKNGDGRGGAKGAGDRRGRFNPQAEFLAHFKGHWAAYLKAMGLSEETVRDAGRLTHCAKIGGETYERSNCEWNPHTELCTRYRRAAAQLPNEVLAVEGVYREWRRSYLHPPRKPVFRYPSSRDLPMPKVFGAGYHEVDLERSVVRLRLDDMREGEWIELGIKPWPREYQPSKREVQVKSVHVHFVGQRARIGLRFDVPHRASRFGCTQDELNELRSRVYPRRSQDQDFIDAARQRLVETFAGDAERSLRLLAVDTGEKGAYGVVYEGRRYVCGEALPIVKINKAYAEVPKELERDKHGRPEQTAFDERTDPRGVRKEHVARHLERMSEGARAIAAHREGRGEPGRLREDDLLGLQRHVSWMIRDWARHNAARIVEMAERHGCDVIVFESQRGNRPPGYHEVGDEATRKKLDKAAFAYGRIRAKVTEKAVERGMRVVTAPYFKSSRVCAACGHEQMNDGLWRKKKRERKFACQCGDASSWKRDIDGKAIEPHPGCGCRAEFNSDENAGRVLARVFWGEVVLPTPKPGEG